MPSKVASDFNPDHDRVLQRESEVLHRAHRFTKSTVRFEVGHLAPQHMVTYGVDPPHVWTALVVHEGVLKSFHSPDGIEWQEGQTHDDVPEDSNVVDGGSNGVVQLYAVGTTLYVAPVTQTPGPALEVLDLVAEAQSIDWNGKVWHILTVTGHFYLGVASYNPGPFFTVQFEGDLPPPLPALAQQQPTSVAAHAWNGVRYLTVGWNGTTSQVWASLDGVNWVSVTPIESPLGPVEPTELVWNGHWWIVAGYVAGRTVFAAFRDHTARWVGESLVVEWRIRDLEGRVVSASTPPGFRVLTLDWNGEYLVAGGEQSSLYYSRKGIEWSPASIPERTADPFTDLHWNGRRWLVAHGPKILESLYGPAWHFTSFHDSFAGAQVQALSHTSLAANAAITPVQIWIATDPGVVSTTHPGGRSWSTRDAASSLLPPDSAFFDGAYDPKTGTLVIAGSQGLWQTQFINPPTWTLRDPSVEAVVFFSNASGSPVWLAGGADFLYSPDGITWTTAFGVFATITDIASSGQSFLAVAAGTRILLVSADGQIWAPADVSAIPAGETFGAVAWLPLSTGSTYLLATNAGKVYALNAGGTGLALRGTLPLTTINAMASNGQGRIVATGQGASVTNIEFSDDGGATWSTASLQEGPFIGVSPGTDVDYAGGNWVLIGRGNRLNGALYSEDGGFWQPASGTRPTGRLIETFSDTGALTVEQDVDITAQATQSVHHVADRYYSATLSVVSATLSE